MDNEPVSRDLEFPIADRDLLPIIEVNRFMKRLEDLTLALCMLLLSLPVLLIIAVGIKLTSPGPIFFTQIRHGRDGCKFKILKFRTMRVHEEPPNHITQACICDERVGRFGLFLRRTSFDELPQLLNVIKGDMSLVGPRPHPIELNEKFMGLIENYSRRHRVKPGITGLAQIHGLRGETDTIDKMRKRVESDLYYIHNWSLWLDLKILLLTLSFGFMHKNAY